MALNFMTKPNKLSQILETGILIGDGAMGTMLYGQGVFLNACFEELNLTNPALIKRVHDGYVSAGVDFIETNTFGGNEFKLGKFGLADKLEQINAEGVSIARRSASSHGTGFLWQAQWGLWVLRLSPSGS